MSPRLANLLDSGLNSPDLRVRAAAIEMELVVYDLPKTRESSDLLIERSRRIRRGVRGLCGCWERSEIAVLSRSRRFER